jgi:hypothetical protein
MTCCLFSEFQDEEEKAEKHTFSWRKCLSNFSSRYVRLDKTGVLKGFIIFLIATGEAVS